MRNSWTDDRLDDFAAHTYRRFDEVDRRLDRVDADLSELRTDMNARFEQMERRFERMEGRIDDLHRTIHRTLLQVGGGAIVTLVVGFAGIIATQL